LTLILGKPDNLLSLQYGATNSYLFIYHFNRVRVVFSLSDLPQPCWAIPGYIPVGGQVNSVQLQFQ
jgi:hypothetical protein